VGGAEEVGGAEGNGGKGDCGSAARGRWALLRGR